MLQPTERTLLLEHFRPPEGYRFDQAIGTTYSLDLVTLMTVPLAFTFFDVEDHNEDVVTEPLALLEALRRHASKVTVFCHAGAISVPRRHRPLFTYLEDSVFECLPTDPRGSFHPKVWLVRYVSDSDLVAYRFLCFSRNLTFDRSWDAALALDGVVTNRKNAFGANQPLREFVKALPRWSKRSLPEERQNSIAKIAAEVARVKWIPIQGFEAKITFWPIGTARRYRHPFPGRRDRWLVVSPFVADGFRAAAGLEGRSEEVLVSRPESIDLLGATERDGYTRMFVLSDEADREAADPAGEDTEEPGEVTNEDRSPDSLGGLHAKLYVADAGWKARMWVGSANATPAAFTRNVEFLVELAGQRSSMGTPAFLEAGPEGVRFRDLIVEYTPRERPPDPTTKEAEKRLDNAQGIVARAHAIASAEPDPGGTTFGLRMALGLTEQWPEQVSISCRPLTLTTLESQGLRTSADRTLEALFPQLSVEALSAFFVFDLTTQVDTQVQMRSFVRRVELEGAPPGRQESLLRQILKDRSQVLRYLLFLLSIEGGDSYAADSAAAFAEQQTSPLARGLGEEALLESLVRTLAHEPRRLDSVRQLVTDLKAGGQDDLIPEGFNEVWDAVWEVRGQLKVRETA